MHVALERGPLAFRAVLLATALGAAGAAWPTLARAQPAVMNPPLAPLPADPAVGVAPPATAPVVAPAPGAEAGAPRPPATTDSSDVDRRLRELEESNRKLRTELDQLKEDHKFTEDRLKQVLPVKDFITGYVDLGFFYVQGNGSGIRDDGAHTVLKAPQYDNVGSSWRFYGDPLATAINSRGEPADLGGSQAIRFDSIANGGAPSFIVNTVTLNFFKGVGDDLTFNGSIDFLPRNRNVSNPDGINLGDYFDLKTAYAEWMLPTHGWGLSLYAGKFDSTLGIEYRTQESTDRIGVTPSLICRYTCGRPLGVKARARFFDERLVAAVSATNGSNFVDIFPFSDQIDVNSVKTLSGRLSYRVPLAGKGLEFGVSGAYGAQDFQTSDSVGQYHFGADVHLAVHDLDVQGEFVTGKAEGQTTPGGMAPCDIAPCLRYQGAYGQVGYRLTNWVMPYARVDGRDAVNQGGVAYAYVTKIMRVTAGAHFEFGTSVLVKAEYTVIRELGDLPQFPDNVFTSSLVMKF